MKYLRIGFILTLGWAGGAAFAQVQIPHNLQESNCSCALSGFTDRWELIVTWTQALDTPFPTVSLGPHYPFNVVRSYAPGEPGKKACQELASARIAETFCGYRTGIGYKVETGTVAGIEKKYGATPLPLLTAKTEIPAKCMNVAGTYRLQGAASCSDTGDRNVGYYIPFPLNYAKPFDLEIRQDGCSEIRVIVSNPDPETKVLPLTGGSDSELRYVLAGAYSDNDSGGLKEWSDYFNLTKFDGGDLRVEAGHWEAVGRYGEPRWARRDCRLAKIK